MRAFGRIGGAHRDESRNGSESLGSGKNARARAQERQASQRLKPERWKSAFDKDGKVVGFSKVLKLIRLGGVDNSIRCEVWEFLLGSYGVGTTWDHRMETRIARRKRYKELIEKCRTMHVSIGTGTLAYNVGSKIMDARTSRQGAPEQITVDSTHYETKGNSTSADASLSSGTGMESYEMNAGSKAGGLPLKTLLLHADNEPSNSDHSPGRIGPNSPNVLHFKFFHQSPIEVGRSSTRIWTNRDRHENFSRVKRALDTGRNISGGPAGMLSPNSVPFQRAAATEERTAEWLWTLHKIVIDVVRTDRHLEFYDDSRNMARMSDILAIYAWIDPETGYCQGMSDLLSPFVILFEDDADAFWCFESLLRRMRQNFQMEGPTGVMRQLEALPKILELIDARVFRHLTLIGADNFLFAFRMLLLHFRRELSFEETLCMWEMMWAADFDHAMLWSFESEPLEPLQIKPPSRSLLERIQEDDCMDYYWTKISPFTSPLPASEDPLSQSSKITYESKSPLCGLVTSWPNFGRHRIRSGMSFGRNGDSEISVFVVAAIVVINREKFLKEARSMDDVIKMFNEIQLKIQVRSCVRAAMKMRTKYHQQLSKRGTGKAKRASYKM
ncbi:small G protein signaling modulator 2 [Selaginella moellendorffii]|uniref:small G protein signaling modulator 2 n=1 Tax=Selaginella moellendorffii TaxID=88036 RepID=UPI000D1CC8B6|nr:small G protein signaling modulator 2 [Selaginella moellendorffii]|eukprot:XP_024542175.1 small G protein signaling modulator 2 [Selaginella moellendorffii]